MAAFTIPNALGYAVGDPVTSAQMNLFNTQIVKAPNWVDGGASYNPTDQLVMGGAGMRWTSTTEFASTSTTEYESGASVTNDGSWTVQNTGRIYVNASGQIIVQSTGEISVQTGAQLDIEDGGAQNWRDGAIITAEDGSTFLLEDGSVLNTAGIVNFGATCVATVSSGATLEFNSGAALTAASGSTSIWAAGSTVVFNETVTLATGAGITLSPARTWTRHSLRICNVAYVGTGATPAPNYEGPERPTAWASNNDGSVDAFGSLFIRTLGTDSDAHLDEHYHWIALDDLPHGGTMSQVVVLAGGNGSSPTTTAKFQIIRMSQTGTVETMSALTDKDGSWGITTQTTVTVTNHGTIDRDYTYALVVLHPTYSGTAGTKPWLKIGDVETSGTMSSIPIG